ncbi:MAG: MFS transporter [Oscillospiraceae bacterium]|nr:MFS transporter [Oscillospiraceae bacterium]
MKRERRLPAAQILYTMMQICYWTGGCIALGFAAAFLHDMGFDNARVGLISASSSLLGFVLMLGVSARIDRAGTGAVNRWVCGLVLAQSVVLAGLLSAEKPGVTAALCYTLYMALTLVLSSLLSKLYIDLRRAGIPIRLGLARGLGSLGYALASLSAGFLMGTLPDLGILGIGHGLFLLTALLAVLLRKDTADAGETEAASATEKRAPVRELLRSSPLFLLLVAGVSLVSAANRTVTVFLVNVVENVGGDMRSFGAVSSYLALLEVPVIFLFAQMKKRWSLSALLVTSMLFYTLKLGGFVLAGSVPMLLLASSLHAFSTGIFQPASVEYVRETIPHRCTATAQGLMTGVPLFLSAATTVLFGSMLDGSSVSATLLLLLAAAALGTALCLAAVLRLRKAD